MSIKPSILEAYNATRDFSEKALHSACFAPWVSLYFDTMGNVQACCQNTKFPVGNIALQTIDEIWQGKKIRTLRKALAKDNFAAGCQFCEWQISAGNYLGTFTRNFERLPVLQEEPEWPAMMEFSISNTCNLECIMCNGTFSSTIRSRRELLPPLPKPYSDEFFAELRKYLPHLKFAKFLGGEPFLAQESYRIWDMMVEDKLQIPCHVTTNGTQWNERVERVLEHVPCSFSISMDGVTKETVESIRVNAPYEVVRENFLRFLAYARSRGTYIGLTYCLMRQNWHEFGDYLLYGDEHDVEVVVNTVREPPHCSLYTLAIDELAEIADALERQGEALLPRLGRNREVWLTQVGAIRKRIENERESSRAPFKTPLSLYIVDLPSLEALPPDQRMNEQRAKEELRRWGGDEPIFQVTCDADDRIREVHSDDGTFWGLPGESCVGQTFSHVVGEWRRRMGEGIVVELHSSGQYVDRLVDLQRDGRLYAMRFISVPVLNEYGLHGGSRAVAMGKLVTAHQEDEAGRATGLLSDWGHGSPVLLLHRNVDDVVESIGEQAAAAIGLDRSEWIGKTFDELGPLIVKQFKLFGETRNQSTWEVTPYRCDRLFSFHSPKRVVSLREVMVRRFDSQGRFEGWTSLMSTMTMSVDHQVMSNESATRLLDEWSPVGETIQLIGDAGQTLQAIEGDSDLIKPFFDLIGRPLADFGGRLIEQYGPFQFLESRVLGGYSDRTLEFSTPAGPIYLRAISWPRFNGSFLAGENQLLRLVRVNASTLALSEEDVREEIEHWSGQDAASVILVDRDRRIVGFDGSAPDWGGDADSLVGQPLESLQQGLVERLGNIRSVEPKRQSPGLWDVVIEQEGSRGRAKTRAVGIPRFDASGAWLGWGVRMASVESNADRAADWGKAVERRLHDVMPGSSIVRLHLDEAGVVQGMDSALLAGIRREDILGRNIGLLHGDLSQRWQARAGEPNVDMRGWCSDWRVDFDGPGGRATVRAVSIAHFDADGRSDGTEMFIAIREMEPVKVTTGTD